MKLIKRKDLNDIIAIYDENIWSLSGAESPDLYKIETSTDDFGIENKKVVKMIEGLNMANVEFIDIEEYPEDYQNYTYVNDKFIKKPEIND